MKKLRVGILFGGRSGEHEVSLLSAASVLNAIDKDKYEVVPIGITKEGRWLTAEHAENLLQGKLVLEPRHLRAGDPETTPAAAVLAQGESVVVPPEPVHRQSGLVPFQTDAALTRRASDRAINVDVIFPVLHGTFGEDGTIQGLLELADIPYVGAGVLGSAAGMDKDIMKSLFIAAGIPIVKHVTILRSAVGEGTEESGEAGGEQAEVSGVCEAGESGIVGGHQQGARPQGTRAGDRGSGEVRPQDRDRAGRRRKEA